MGGQNWVGWPEAFGGSHGRSAGARLGPGACTHWGESLGQQRSLRVTLPSLALGTGMLDLGFRLLGDTQIGDLGHPDQTSMQGPLPAG